MIEFKCACGEALQAEDQHAGRVTRCPNCGREQPIPSPRDDGILDVVPVERARVRPRDVQQEPSRHREDRPYAADARRESQTSGKAIAALAFGLASLVFSCFAALPALLFGLLALMEIGKSNGRLSGKGLAVTGMLLSAFSLLCIAPGLIGFGYYKVGATRDRIQSSNNLHQLAIAMHSYSDSTGSFPPAQGISPKFFGAGEPPRVSWRVLILPYIEGEYLFAQYNFNEPWDGPNNIKLLDKMPTIYKLPGDKTAPPGYTYYQVFVSDPSSSPHAMFSTDPEDRVHFLDIMDGSSNTIMIVEAATPVPWTKPEDISFDNNRPAPRIGTHYNGGCNAAFADGSVHYLSGNLSPTTLKALITRDGGELIGVDF